MLFIACFSPPQKGISNKIKRIFGDNGIERLSWNIDNVKCDVVSGCPYGDKGYFYRLKNVVKDDIILFPKDFDLNAIDRKGRLLYPHPSFNRSNSGDYLNRLMVNFVKELLEKLSVKNRQHLLLIDEDARCTGVAIELLKVCHRLSVYTQHPERYQLCVKYAFEKFGTHPEIITDRQENNRITLMVAPYGLCGFNPRQKGCPLISLKPSDNGFYPPVQGIVFSDVVTVGCPEFISKTELASALFLLKGHYTQDKLAFLRKGHRNFPLEAMEEIILDYMQTKTSADKNLPR